MRFEFATAGRIVFGAGVVAEAGPITAQLGRHALVVTGKDRGRASVLFDALAASEVAVAKFAVPGEPTIETAQRATAHGRTHGCDVIVGFGGGSVIDTAKAVAALLANPGDPFDYLEVIGDGQPLTKPAIPCVAIPTTAGTGAEVTRNAVLRSAEHNVKVSLRSATMLPRVAIVDPVLTHSLSPEVTASTGLDALAQVLEPFVSNRPNPLTDAICRQGMGCAARSLRRAYENGDDEQARSEMAQASLFGGLALANAKLGAVHGFAGPVGGMFPVPHGVVCGLLLPYVVQANVRALQERDQNNDALRRYDEVARLLTGEPTATAATAVSWIGELCGALQVPKLAHYGVSSKDVSVLVDKSKNASSMKGNPIELTEQELTHILTQAL